MASNIVKPEPAIEFLHETHCLWGEHVETRTAIMNEVVMVSPVNLLHHILGTVMLGKVH